MKVSYFFESCQNMTCQPRNNVLLELWTVDVSRFSAIFQKVLGYSLVGFVAVFEKCSVEF